MRGKNTSLSHCIGLHGVIANTLDCTVPGWVVEVVEDRTTLYLEDGRICIENRSCRILVGIVDKSPLKTGRLNNGFEDIAE